MNADTQINEVIMFQVKLTELEVHNLSYQGRIALIGKYRDRRQWISRTAYKSCLREIRQAKEYNVRPSD